MKRIIVVCLFTVLVSVGATKSANAFLISDTIILQHRNPLGTVKDSAIRTVEAGLGDIWFYFPPAPSTYVVNPEDDYISTFFLTTDTFSGPAFNGLIVAGIDAELTGVNVITNMAGWTDSRLGFTANAIAANWSGLSYSNQTFFRMNLESASNAVPEPGTMVLFGSGLLAMIRSRRKIIV